MDLDAYRRSPVGSLAAIEVVEHAKTVAYHAFVPDALSDNPELTAATWNEVVEAGRQLGQLSTLATERLPDPLLISRPTIRREAVSTSALEGTFAPPADVLVSEMEDEPSPSEAVREVLNFIQATDHALASSLPVCVRLCCELQRILVHGTKSEDYQAGKVRETQVFIGPYKGCSITESVYVPPPPGDVLNEGLSAWERWIHADSDLNPIVKVAMAHYQFEALHPFTDGNGRIGRLVAILQLIEADLLPGPLINLSPYFEKRAEEYRYRLGTVSTDGDIDGWVRFFCRALASQAAEAGDRIRQLLEWRDTTVADLRSMRHKGTTITIVESLIQYPSFTVKFMADRLGVSVPTANAAVNRLTELGILEEVTGRRYNRSFRATEVMRIIFS